jgi:hypothetical protein
MQKTIKNNKIIIDNLCPKPEADAINEIYVGEHFPWYFKNYVVDETMIKDGTENYQYQFTHHLLREDGNIVTEQNYWQALFPIFNRIHPNTFVRIKANLVPRADKVVVHGFHVDCMVPFSITGIYYCNTNNGYTAFEDGDQIESVQNRLVLFPSNMKHSGSTCTDVNSRVAININFIPRYVEDSMYKDIIDVEVWNQIQKWCDKVE